MKLNNERNYALLHSGLIVYPIGSTMRTCPFEGNINTKLLGIDVDATLNDILTIAGIAGVIYFRITATAKLK